MPVTLKPGSCPPSPGLAPWATLISISRQVVQVFRGDAEPAGRDLLDRRRRVVAVGARRGARRVLAALAGVGARADAVHRDRQGLMRLGAQCAERDAGCHQALADFGDALDLIDRDRAGLPLRRSAEIQQVAQRDRRHLPHRLGIAADRYRSCRWRRLPAACGSGRASKAWVSPRAAQLVDAADRQRGASLSQAFACSSSTLRAMPVRPMPEMRDCMPGKNSATSARDRPIASKL